MLENQAWMRYETDLYLEYIQAKDEGRMVDHLKSVCDRISEQSKDKNLYDQAVKVREELLNSPISPDYPFVEPSTLEEIKASRPNKRHTFENNLDSDTLLDKLSGAWIGRISGCLLGKPIEGVKRKEIDTLLKCTDNFPMERYIEKALFDDKAKEVMKDRLDSCWADTITVAPIDDDTNYTVFALKLIEEYGKEFTPNDVLEGWLSWIPMFATCTAERIAYRNAAMGMYAPDTASFNNPYREWIGAQIRGDFFGYINPANPEKAAEMGFRDASISHVKNGIYGEMFAAAMIAAAAVCDDIQTVIQAGLDEIPKQCRLRHDIELVLDWHKQGIDEIAVIDNIHKTYDEYSPHGWCHTNSNAMIVVFALLYGNKEFGKSICLAVQSAFDTDCNGATVGSIIGIMLGKKAIPPYWYGCYNSRLSTSIWGYNEVSVDMLAEKTLEIINSDR